MPKYKYVGSISPVGMRNKGLIKTGDIIDFTENEVVGLSSENWEKIKIKSFDEKIKPKKFTEVKEKKYRKATDDELI